MAPIGGKNEARLKRIRISKKILRGSCRRTTVYISKNVSNGSKKHFKTNLLFGSMGMHEIDEASAATDVDGKKFVKNVS